MICMLWTKPIGNFFFFLPNAKSQKLYQCELLIGREIECAWPANISYCYKTCGVTIVNGGLHDFIFYFIKNNNLIMWTPAYFRDISHFFHVVQLRLNRISHLKPYMKVMHILGIVLISSFQLFELKKIWWLFSHDYEDFFKKLNVFKILVVS